MTSEPGCPFLGWSAEEEVGDVEDAPVALAAAAAVVSAVSASEDEETGAAAGESYRSK